MLDRMTGGFAVIASTVFMCCCVAYARQCHQGRARHRERDFVRGDRHLWPWYLLWTVFGRAGAALVAGTVCDRRFSSRRLLVVVLVG